MPSKKLNLMQKLAVVEEAELTGNVRRAAAKWRIYTSTVENGEKLRQN